MNSKIEKLKEWGCDVDTALKRMLNDEDFYLECLETIPIDANFEGLAQALEKGDAAVAFDHAHALKGILANLELAPMLKKDEEIVEPLRKGDIANLNIKFKELEKMRDYLSDILR